MCQMKTASKCRDLSSGYHCGNYPLNRLIYSTSYIMGVLHERGSLLDVIVLTYA